jgi:hypothetical protein
MKVVESNDGSTSFKESTPHRGSYENGGIGDTTSSIGNNSSALNIDTVVPSSNGDISSPKVRFCDDS